MFYSSNVFKVLAIVVILIAGWMVFDAARSYPIGDNKIVEYLGRKSVGSWMPLSSMTPTDVYYYGTDLNPEELADYFGAKAVANHGTIDYRITLEDGGKQSFCFTKIKIVNTQQLRIGPRILKRGISL
jgi:hypothetical protein